MQFCCWFPVFLAYRTCWWIAPAGEKLSINTWSLAFLPLELSTNKLHAAFDSLFLSRYRACCPYDVYVQWLLYGSESRSIMYTFIYSNLHSHGYEDVTIHHQRTCKNTITLLNFPYIHSHTQSHSPRAPQWPSPPAFCGLVLAVNQYVVASFSPAGAIHQQYLVNRYDW